MMKMLKSEVGLTLMEVLLSLALIAILIPILFSIFNFGSTVFTKGSHNADTQNEVSLIAYKISNDLRYVEGIRLTEETGYTLYDVKSRTSTKASIHYTLKEKNGQYMLKFDIEDEFFQVSSEIPLANVNEGQVGEVLNKIWIKEGDYYDDNPRINIGNASHLYRKGDGEKIITFPVTVQSIPNSAELTVSMPSQVTGITLLSEKLLLNNEVLEIKVQVNDHAEVGMYPFEVAYGEIVAEGIVPILDGIEIYRVKFDANGGLVEALPNIVEVESGLALGDDMPITPSFDGYTFLGWNTEKNGSGEVFTGTTTVYHHLTVYAQWISTVSSAVEIVDAVSKQLSIQLDGTNQKKELSIKLPQGMNSATIEWKRINSGDANQAIKSMDGSRIEIIDIGNNNSTQYQSKVMATIKKDNAKKEVQFTITARRISNGAGGIEVVIVKNTP